MRERDLRSVLLDLPPEEKRRKGLWETVRSSRLVRWVFWSALALFASMWVWWAVWRILIFFGLS